MDHFNNLAPFLDARAPDWSTPILETARSVFFTSLIILFLWIVFLSAIEDVTVRSRRARRTSRQTHPIIATFDLQTVAENHRMLKEIEERTRRTDRLMSHIVERAMID